MFDASAIKELSRAEAITAVYAAVAGAMHHGGGSGDGVLAVPNDFTVHDLEKYLANRRRLRGTMTTTSVTDFAEYTKANAEEGTAAVFVDTDKMEAVAVLNLGTPTRPGHADNRAKLAPKKTAAYLALCQAGNGQVMKQSTVAEFLEDWPDQVACSNDETLIATAKAIAAVRKITIEGLRKVESEEKKLGAAHSTFESVQATSGPDPLPTIITFKCVPYLGLTERTFALRLSIQTGNATPGIVLRVVKHEQHAEEMAEELASLVRAAMGDIVQVLIGAYSAAS